MKKQLLNLGKALNKAEQKLILGGTEIMDEGGCLSMFSQCEWTLACCSGLSCKGYPGGIHACL